MLVDESSPIDYLVIGHICHDLVQGGKVTGGAAAYGASTARVLGCRAAVLTSAAPQDDWQRLFPEILVVQHPATATTVFENVYTHAGRIQTLHSVAEPLSVEHVPATWTRASIVHIAPIANEVDPAIVELFSDSLVGVGPQGWMRRWDAQGRVYQVPWEGAERVLPLAAATFLSLEDLAAPEELEAYRRLANVLVVTDGRRGCTVYFRDQVREFPAPRVEVADTTGAGDVFAAAYLVRFRQTDGDMWESARFANEVAAGSVTAAGLEAKMDALQELANVLAMPAGPA